MFVCICERDSVCLCLCCTCECMYIIHPPNKPTGNVIYIMHNSLEYETKFIPGVQFHFGAVRR